MNDSSQTANPPGGDSLQLTLENSDESSSLISTRPVVPLDVGQDTKRAVVTSRQWLVGPWFDLLLVANVAWPLLLLIQWNDGFEGRAGLQFWQVYFVTTPHRWITLAMVFLDRERFQQKRMLFVGLLFGVVAACVAVRWTTGALTCLLTIDYIWNAWHFAAQHQGIYRIYGRQKGSADGWHTFAERWLLRSFLLYVTLRVAIATWIDSPWQSTFEAVDWIIPAAPLFLLMRDLIRHRVIATGGIAYLASISSLYLSLLWAVHARRPALVLSLTTASALFHALEYLSIVSWSVYKRDVSTGTRSDWLHVVASEWLITLASFLLILGAGAWLLDQQFKEEWLSLNIAAAFLHYSYDSLIWRRRSGSRPIAVVVGPASV